MTSWDSCSDDWQMSTTSYLVSTGTLSVRLNDPLTTPVIPSLPFQSFRWSKPPLSLFLKLKSVIWLFVGWITTKILVGDFYTIKKICDPEPDPSPIWQWPFPVRPCVCSVSRGYTLPPTGVSPLSWTSFSSLVPVSVDDFSSLRVLLVVPFFTLRFWYPCWVIVPVIFVHLFFPHSRL